MPALIAFLNGAVQRHWETQPDLLKKLTDQMAIWYGPEARNPVHIEIQNWSQEKYIQGGPVAVFGPGVLSQMKEPLDTPVGRIFFAGTEFATISQGFMDGAIQSGKRAAKKIFNFDEKHSNQEIFEKTFCFDKSYSNFEKLRMSFKTENNNCKIGSNFKTQGSRSENSYDIYNGSKFQMNQCFMFYGLIILMICWLLKIWLF